MSAMGASLRALRDRAIILLGFAVLPPFWLRTWWGTALARRACRDGLSASGPVELFRVNGWRGFAIRGALRPIRRIYIRRLAPRG